MLEDKNLWWFRNRKIKRPDGTIYKNLYLSDCSNKTGYNMTTISRWINHKIRGFDYL